MTVNTELRKEILETRNSLKKEQVLYTSEKINNQLKTLLDKDYKHIDTFLCYYPLGNEVDITQTYRQLLSHSKKLYFPVTKGDSMDFYRVRSLEELVKGRFSIMEPVPDSKNLLPLEASQEDSEWICFTPGVVFDRENNRMGFGRGFYDRFFTRENYVNQKVIKIGLAYDFQVVEKIDTNPWDVPLDLVLTCPT